MDKKGWTVNKVHEKPDPERDDTEIRGWLADFLKRSRHMKEAILLAETDNGYEVFIAGEHHNLERVVAECVTHYDGTLKERGMSEDDNPGLGHLLGVGLYIATMRDTASALMRAIIKPDGGRIH